MIKNLGNLLQMLYGLPRKTIAVAAAEDRDIIEVAKVATEMNIAEFILVGDKEKIHEISKDISEEMNFTIIDEKDHKLAAEKAVELVVQGRAQSVMKGLLHTSVFLKAVLNKESGLNSGRLVSHVAVIDNEFGEGLQLITDCAMAIEPSIDEKKQIIENSIIVANKLGITKPKVALISAVETVNPSIKDTVDAAILSKMSDRGQIRGAFIDGPFALDNAISIEAATHKGIEGVVAGHADILVMPNLQVGNVLYKSLTYYAKKDIASVVVGAKVPVIMTSRTDSIRNKVLTVTLACYIAR